MQAGRFPDRRGLRAPRSDARCHGFYRYGDQTAVVTFGPGRPVHFDIQVPNQGHGTPADEASFTLRAPGGEIPGTSVAAGRFEVASGTVIGPVQPGA